MSKNLLFLTFTSLFFVNNLFSQNLPTYLYEAIINIPDPNFEQALIDLGYDSDGIINQSINAQDAFDIKNLDISSRNISNLQGLEYFKNLRTLNCSENNFNELKLEHYVRIQLKYYTEEFRAYQSLIEFTCSNSILESIYFYRFPDIESINLNSNPNLKSFIAEKTPNLINLKLSNTSNLEQLELHDTSVSSLKVDTFTALMTLRIIDSPLEGLDLNNNKNLKFLDCSNSNLNNLDLSNNNALQSIHLVNNQLSFLDMRNGNNSLISNFDSYNHPNLSCIFIDDLVLANSNESFYNRWNKDEHTEFRNESCDYDITLSTSKMNIAENGEQTILTATLNDISPSEDITVNLKLSGTAASTNYELSSSSILIPASQLSASVTLTALEDAMDSDKTVVIDVLSVENADILSSQELTVTINHVNDAPTDISLVTASFDENLSYEEMTLIEVADIDDVEHTISLVQGEGSSDNDKFTIIDNKLYTDLTFDYETKNEYFIRLKATDPEGLSTEKAIVISVNNLNDIVISGTIGKTYCGTDTIGFIETAFAEYIEPLTYQWSSGETTRNISNKPSGTYTITVTDGDGVVMSKDFEIGTEPIYNDLTICYVSSDNIDSDYNRIFINNAESYNVDKIQILREGSTLGQYELIGEISPYENSFLDTSSNNQSVSYNYKVRIKDKCGNVSELSPFHQTILLQANKASDGSINLNWSAYSGLNYGTYDIYRKENNNDFELLTSLSANNLAYNDKDVNSNTKSYDYFIGITVSESCNFTLISKAKNSKASNNIIRSNYKSFESTLNTDLDLRKSISIFPNPVEKSLYIESEAPLLKIEIYSFSGKKVKEIKSDFKTIDLNNLERGLYLINIYSENGFFSNKIIKN
ncbi:T9SS type A sorting domain-containing protein [Tamlana crocina]|uniref:T9SS type A sorting domain-containing protein n=1 Tax=Tamlana crocina TaxID=393006 RepID=A0ABX1DGH0_9FLAO|nr:T9SS type A sorting domain-containing protein [Tamlana crocina]NJX16849.1 T9SS type A sorting domain-containing protein [Tamlana crocina]